jgi:hypothetical protein
MIRLLLLFLNCLLLLLTIIEIIFELLSPCLFLFLLNLKELPTYLLDPFLHLALIKQCNGALSESVLELEVVWEGDVRGVLCQ